MKKTYLLLMISMLVFTGCENTEDGTGFLELEKDTATFSADARTQRIKVSGTNSWSFYKQSPADDWFTLSKSTDQLVIDVTENLDQEQRSAEVTITHANLSRTLKIVQIGSGAAVLPEKSTFSVKNHESTLIVQIVSNIDYEVQVPQKDQNWIAVIPATKTRSVDENEVHLAISANDYTVARSSLITLQQTGGDYTSTFTIIQAAGSGGIEDVEIGDSKIQIIGGSTSSYQPSEPFHYSFDGDRSTRWHTQWEPKDLALGIPVDMIYWFGKQADVDYICYYPRGESENGLIGVFDLYYKTERSAEEYTFIDTYDFQQQGTSILMFDEPVRDAIEFKFVVKSGKSNDVSCGEMEFYTITQAEGVPDVFANNIYTELKEGVTLEQIETIANSFYRNIARGLFDKSYPEWRIQEYEAYLPISALAAEIKTSTYNRFENPTGIYFEEGEEVVVFAENVGTALSLRVRDFNEGGLESSYAITPGGVKLKLGHRGLGYIDYFTPGFETAPTATIHIIGGKNNGRFDRNRSQSDDWQGMLNNAVYDVIDITGNYVNLVFLVQNLKTHCNDGMGLIEAYDNIVHLQYDIMGLVKYGRVPKNHMFGRWVTSGYFADGMGAGFDSGGVHNIHDPARILKEGIWGLAHEFGHVNQVRPALKWHGMTETSNNFYSILTQWKYFPENLGLERVVHNDGDGNQVIGGRFNAYLNNGVMRGQPWPCQKGPDKMTGYETGGDHFVRLCPFWQLFLYYMIIDDAEWSCPDWFRNLAEKARTQDDSGKAGYELQIQFMKDVCDQTQQDLSDFFATAGLLKPIDIIHNDYGEARHVITEDDCLEVKAYASKYAKPVTPVLNYISANSLDAFRNHKAVEGVYNTGIRGEASQGYFIIEHSVWKNVVVFETYKGATMERVAMVGTDSQYQTSTLVRYPAGSTRIEAVAWDGTRTLVYGTR